MDIKRQLADFKARFDPVLAAYVDERIADARSRDAFTADGLARCKAIILGGGKRLRPALTAWSYEGLGGADSDAILRAAVGVEILHAYLLVHDDIMDRDAMRHGVTTLHEHYRKQFAADLGAAEAVHAGNSVALVFGDLLNAMGNHALFGASFDPQRVLAVFLYVQEVIHHTGIGQIKDVLFEYGTRASVEDVLRMYEYKTARYTIESPLVIGALFAGADDACRAKIRAFARPLGVAFQIRDDIIGLFGDEATIGKPVGSDIAEGKVTLLVALAREAASRDARARLDALLGRKDLTAEDIATFRAIITESGARAAAEERAAAMIAASTAALATLPYAAETKATLAALADYLTRRSV